MEWFPITQKGSRIAGVLLIRCPKTTTCYRVIEQEVGNGFDGRGFELVKAYGGTDRSCKDYQTFVTRPGANGIQDSCSCRGWLRTRNCKHLDAMKQVAQNGQP